MHLSHVSNSQAYLFLYIIHREPFTGRDRTATAEEQGCSHGSCKEAKDVGEWKRKYREKTFYGVAMWNQEIQARCF